MINKVLKKGLMHKTRNTITKANKTFLVKLALTM